MAQSKANAIVTMSNIARQRQPRNSLAFAMEDELTRSPIDIVELKSRDLTAAKSESSQQKHNGEAAAAHVGAAVATVHKLLKLSKKALSWVDRNGVHERLPVEAADYSKPRISPDGRRATGRRGGDIWTLDLVTTAWNRLTVEGGSRPRIPISGGQDQEPAWSRDGKELFFVTDRGDGTFTFKVVDVETSLGFTDARPRTLFEMDDKYGEMMPQRSYDVSPDGQRFLMAQWVERQNRERPTVIHLVQNWFQELERLVPTND